MVLIVMHTKTMDDEFRKEAGTSDRSSNVKRMNSWPISIEVCRHWQDFGRISTLLNRCVQSDQ